MSRVLTLADRAEILKLADVCADNKDGFGLAFYNASIVRFAIAISRMSAAETCPSCEALARTVMLDQTGRA